MAEVYEVVARDVLGRERSTWLVQGRGSKHEAQTIMVCEAGYMAKYGWSVTHLSATAITVKRDGRNRTTEFRVRKVGEQ